jgi:hypothetical protein
MSMLVFFRAEDGEGMCSSNDLGSLLQQRASRMTSVHGTCLDSKENATDMDGPTKCSSHMPERDNLLTS